MVKKKGARVLGKSKARVSNGSDSVDSIGVWFRKRQNSEDKWGFIPINWKGWVALGLLIGLNVFAANYFNLRGLILDSYLRMGVVFFLSIFVFIEIAKKKTRV